jgi:hypothetical protein
MHRGDPREQRVLRGRRSAPLPELPDFPAFNAYAGIAGEEIAR